MFQFHKVRLKEANSDRAAAIAAFQFHKVRLKEQPTYISRAEQKAFQFHKVRLKEKGKSGNI